MAELLTLLERSTERFLRKGRLGRLITNVVSRVADTSRAASPCPAPLSATARHSTTGHRRAQHIRPLPTCCRSSAPHQLGVRGCWWRR